MKHKILISACLLGQPVRYDGQSKELENATLKQWHHEGRLVPICPEVSGGLPVPRAAAEITGIANNVPGGIGFVKTENDVDVSHFFLRGAHHALDLCRQQNIRVAILKDNSPSCGSTQVYDGSFNGRLIPGDGITAAMLSQNGIRVFSEREIDVAADYINPSIPA